MSETLSAYRAKIDKIDAELRNLLDERFLITEQIGRYKKEQGLPVLDKDREKVMRTKQEDEVAHSQQKEYIVAVWQTILLESKRQQANLRADTHST